MDISKEYKEGSNSWGGGGGGGERPPPALPPISAGISIYFLVEFTLFRHYKSSEAEEDWYKQITCLIYNRSKKKFVPPR